MVRSLNQGPSPTGGFAAWDTAVHVVGPGLGPPAPRPQGCRRGRMREDLCSIGTVPGTRQASSVPALRTHLAPEPLKHVQRDWLPLVTMGWPFGSTLPFSHHDPAGDALPRQARVLGLLGGGHVGEKEPQSLQCPCGAEQPTLLLWAVQRQ